MVPKYIRGKDHYDNTTLPKFLMSVIRQMRLLSPCWGRHKNLFLEFNLTIMYRMYIHPSYLSLSSIATAPPLANKLDSNKSDHSSMDVYNMD